MLVAIAEGGVTGISPAVFVKGKFGHVMPDRQLPRGEGIGIQNGNLGSGFDRAAPRLREQVVKPGNVPRKLANRGPTIGTQRHAQLGLTSHEWPQQLGNDHPCVIPPAAIQKMFHTPCHRRIAL